MVRVCHGQWIFAGFQGMSTQAEVRRGGPSLSVIHVVTTERSLR